jgi:replicative DNA helicase
MTEHPRNFMDRVTQTQHRFLPVNIIAEQALLGSMLMNNDVITDLPGTFDPSHFYEPLHRDIFDTVKRNHDAGKRANTVTVKTAVDKGQMIEDMTVSQYLARLAGEAVSIVNAKDFAAAITFEAMRRGAISVGEQTEDLGFQCGEELSFLEQAEALRDQLTRIIRGLEGEDEATLADASRRAMDATNKAYQGGGEVGVDYGFAPLMNLIGPAMPSHLIVVGGGTKQGKSSLIEQIVMGAAMNGHPVWIYSGEMKGEELAQRALSRITDIQAWRQARGKVSDSEYEQLENARRNAETWQRRVILKDKPMTLTQIGRAVEAFSKRHRNGMVVIDHIGLVERDKDSARMSPTDFGPVVTRTLKLLANKANVPIFAAAQLKKNTFVSEYQRPNKAAFAAAASRRPKATDLIGACEADANHVVCPFRAEPILEEMKPGEDDELFGFWQTAAEKAKGKAELVLALSRHTRYPQSKDVNWNGAKTQFEDPAAVSQQRMF